jgi:hypothetical protein
VRVVVRDDLRRNRLTVFFRLFLAIPHFIWLALWGIAAFFAAVANWLMVLATGRPPAALYRFLSAYVKYGTHVYGYFLLGADPYPTFDGRDGYPVDLQIDSPAVQKRLGVAFRLVLVIPALLVVAALFGSPSYRTTSSSGESTTVANYASGVAHVSAILGWFVCVARARMPRGLRDAVMWGIGAAAQLWAYLLVLTERYPEFDPELLLEDLPVQEGPIALRVDEPLRRSRLTVFFRLPLTFPHLVWLTLWTVVAFLAAVASWFATLVRGTSPAALHRFLSAYLRYQTHVYAFLTLAGNPFPGFAGEAGSYPAELDIAARQRQNRWTVGFRWILVIPALILASAYGAALWTCAFLGWFAALVTGRMPRRLRAVQIQALRVLAQVNGYLTLLTDTYPYLGPARAPLGDGGPAPTAESAFG